MSIKIEKVSLDAINNLNKALSALPMGSIGTLDTISFNSWRSIPRSVQIKLYLERTLGAIVQNFVWTADFENKQECEEAAAQLGYRSYAALLADTRNRFVEKVVI